MNWSTRLRRWVRMRTPPVREASMKPTAATVLPAPVACSNQKRRLAPGSSGASATASVSSSPSLLPVLGLLVGREHLVVLVELGDGAVAVRPLAVGLPVGLAVAAVLAAWPAAPSSSATMAARVPERASTWWSLSSRAVEQLRRLLVEEPLEPEQQRVVASPLERRRLGARRRARRARRRPPAAGRCRAPDRRSSRRRAGSARGRTPALDRGRSRSARQPRSRLRQWYWPWARGGWSRARR